jgi:hypothetical protein
MKLKKVIWMIYLLKTGVWLSPPFVIQSAVM